MPYLTVLYYNQNYASFDDHVQNNVQDMYSNHTMYMNELISPAFLCWLPALDYKDVCTYSRTVFSEPHLIHLEFQ